MNGRLLMVTRDDALSDVIGVTLQADAADERCRSLAVALDTLRDAVFEVIVVDARCIDDPVATVSTFTARATDTALIVVGEGDDDFIDEVLDHGADAYVPLAAVGTGELRRAVRAGVRRRAGGRHTRQLQLVAMAAHEIRNPLTTIGGFATMLERRWEDLDDDTVRRAISAISRQSDRLGRMAVDILTLARAERGALQARRESVAVGDIVAEVVEPAGLDEVTIDVAEEIEVRGDADHLRHILGNYVRNAAKYGGGPVRIDARVVENRAQIRVIDSGEGVAPEFAPRLFEPFARGASDLDGSGVGLAVVEALASASDGHVWYEPAPSGGACFVVSLPLAVAPDVAGPFPAALVSALRGLDVPRPDAAFRADLRGRLAAAAAIEAPELIDVG